MTFLATPGYPRGTPQVVQNSENSCFPCFLLFPLFPGIQASLAYRSGRNGGFAAMYPEPLVDGFPPSREPLIPGSRDHGITGPRDHVDDDNEEDDDDDGGGGGGRTSSTNRTEPHYVRFGSVLFFGPGALSTGRGSEELRNRTNVGSSVLSRRQQNRTHFVRSVLLTLFSAAAVYRAEPLSEVQNRTERSVVLFCSERRRTCVLRINNIM